MTLTFEQAKELNRTMVTEVYLTSSSLFAMVSS